MAKVEIYLILFILLLSKVLKTYFLFLVYLLVVAGERKRK